MARPAEKARAMLNKWVAMRDAGNENSLLKSRPKKRPHLANECEHLSDAERYRNQIVREISTALSKLQNPALPEHEIRQLNDEINLRMREKYHWNKRIYELGGVNYNEIEKRRQIEQGDVQVGMGYRYFGVAKNLPGVKELIEQHAEKMQRSSKQRRMKGGDGSNAFYRNISPDYFGWRDEEDGVLLELEERATAENEHVYKRLRLDTSINAKSTDPNVSGKEGENENEHVDDDPGYLQVASQADIAKILLEHKKKALLDKYML